MGQVFIFYIQPTTHSRRHLVDKTENALVGAESDRFLMELNIDKTAGFPFNGHGALSAVPENGEPLVRGCRSITELQFVGDCITVNRDNTVAVSQTCLIKRG